MILQKDRHNQLFNLIFSIQQLKYNGNYCCPGKYKLINYCIFALFILFTFASHALLQLRSLLTTHYSRQWTLATPIAIESKPKKGLLLVEIKLSQHYYSHIFMIWYETRTGWQVWNQNSGLHTSVHWPSTKTSCFPKSCTRGNINVHGSVPESWASFHSYVQHQ